MTLSDAVNEGGDLKDFLKIVSKAEDNFGKKVAENPARA